MRTSALRSCGSVRGTPIAAGKRAVRGVAKVLVRDRMCSILAGVNVLTSLLRRRVLLLALLIVAIAALFRLWRLASVPPGLFGDEAANGLDALDVLAGRSRVFFTANYGREGLAMQFFAAAIRLGGVTAPVLRLPSVLAGILTAWATFWLGQALLRHTRYQGLLAPALAALFLATSFWHVYTSRYAERLIFTPLMATLAFAAFWQAVNQPTRAGRWRWFLLAGVFLGTSLHFYSIARLLPVFLGTYLIAELVYTYLAGARSNAMAEQPLLRRDFAPLAALFAAALLVFAPLGLYFLRNPERFSQRADVVSVFNPALNNGNPLGLMMQAGAANLAQFVLPGAGDKAWFFNLPGRAVFDPLSALLAGAGMLLGIVWLLHGLRRRADATATRQGARLLFLFLAFWVMLVPGLLAADRFPALPRVMGVIPAVYFFPALALAELWQQVQRRGMAARAAAATLIVAALLVHGGLTWRDYFSRWAADAATFDAFEGDIAAAAQWAAAHPDETVYLAADIYRHPTWLFLHEQVPLSTVFDYSNPAVHFFDGRFALPLPAAGDEATYLFTANAGPDMLLQSAPGWRGFSTPDTTQPGLTVRRLDSTALRREALRPARLAFSSGLTLQGYAPVALADGSTAWYFLWQVDGPHPGWFRGLQLQAGWQPLAGGAQLAQNSVELAYRPTEWATDGALLSWITLPALPADAPAVALALRLIDVGNGAALPAAESDADGWVLLSLSDSQ